MKDDRFLIRICLLTLLALGAAVAFVQGCASPAQLEAIGGQVNAMAEQQRGMQEAQAKYIAAAQDVQRRAGLGELTPIQAEAEQRRLESERFVEQQRETTAALERAAAVLEATRNAITKPEGAAHTADALERFGVPGVITTLGLLAHELYRNRTRKQALELVTAKEGAA